MANSLTPAPLRGVWPDFDWDNRLIWALDTPTCEMSIEDFTWLLDLPLWSSRPPEPLFDVRPQDVLTDPVAHPLHSQRVQHADLTYPLDVLHYRGRWVTLDGLHRLARLVSEGARTVLVRRQSTAIQHLSTRPSLPSRIISRSGPMLKVPRPGPSR